MRKSAATIAAELGISPQWRSITVSMAADHLGVSRQWVRMVCDAEQIGQLINPRLRLLTAADFQELCKHVGSRCGNRPKRKRSK